MTHPKSSWFWQAPHLSFVALLAAAIFFMKMADAADVSAGNASAPAPKPPVNLSINLDVTKSDTVADTVDPNTGLPADSDSTNKKTRGATTNPPPHYRTVQSGPTQYVNGPNGQVAYVPVTNVPDGPQISYTDRVYKIRVNNYTPAVAENLTVDCHVYVQTAITSDDGSVKPSNSVKDETETKTVTVPGNDKVEVDTKNITFGTKLVPIAQTQAQVDNNFYSGTQSTPRYVRTTITILGYHIVVKQGETELTTKSDPMDVVSKVEQINKRNEAIKNGTSIL